MLEIREATLRLGDAGASVPILQGVSLHFPRPHFAAIVGPSGCGKSTLLKVIAGLFDPQVGTIHWDGRNLATEGDIPPAELGYVPQFSIVHESLTIAESMDYALRLRLSGLSHGERTERAQQILEVVGLFEIRDRPASQLSGGQRRRLALALEVVTRPSLLLCDEVTSGLDPKSEDEIVQLLHQLSRDGSRLVLSVTHSLRHLRLYDSVTVLREGSVLYSGPAENLLEYFNVSTPEDLFPQLESKETVAWSERWAIYQENFALPLLPGMAEADRDDEDDEEDFPEEAAAVKPELAAVPEDQTPGLLAQFFILLGRRWRLFFREKNQVLLQLALLFLFPALVVPFALNGLPQIQNLSLSADGNIVAQLKESVSFTAQSSRVGSLVSGLIMFQVVLMTLMGSNNGAREIVAERLLFEKEKLAGLNPLSYLISKIFFLGVLVLAQSFWMTIFVKLIVRFPGDLAPQAAMLFLANAALTCLCLGVSSWSRTTEQSSLISVYFVGFQLPLSGAVLALPDWLGVMTRPFISAYWSWSGFLETMRDTRFYDLVKIITETPLASYPACFWVLGCQALVGLIIAYFGCVRAQWD
ncbi:MAG: hypothetical protein B9S32_11955 [Verrucomicrobia bacterium Tous-C9LFEB]|nr:MAG: hypothetical protein B9S32_11955 [Verrucomicrobia bacterium Tous-C9LFEB]